VLMASIVVLSALMAVRLPAMQAPASPDVVQLPAPTGPYAVGRTVFHWTDSLRTDPFDAPLSARREVMVYVWYPADRLGVEREDAYIPHLDTIRRMLGDSLTRQEFGTALGSVVAGGVRSRVLAHPAMSRTPAAFPVLVFSHGFGESSLTYSGQLVDLASHGFVVFGIEHPHDAYAVWLPGGRVVPFAAAQWEAARARPQGAVAYQLAQVVVRAADIRFVIDQIGRLNAGRGPDSLFARRLDLKQLGAFGHSLGGIAAASACRTDARIRACANEDADDDGRPFDGGWAASPIKQPFLFMASGHSIYVSPRTPPPTPASLDNMKLTRAQYDSIVGLYQRNQDDAMASFPGGAIRVMAESSDFTHRTFIDLKLLQATDSAAVEKQGHYLDLIRLSVRAFFDQTLRGRTDTPLDRAAPLDSIVTIQHFRWDDRSAHHPS
jgi:predicted dienelactone hydrolase